ncbi:MAG TPA: ABC transporter substrate-binding protein [Burkholderiales bacterium]|nr:ABC transporter substrate-binding protein [Burkholderiales bacterium]
MPHGAERALAGLALAALTTLAAAQNADMPPDALVKQVTLEVVSIIKSDSEIRSGDRKKIIGLIEAKVLPHFDFATMTATAVGLGWRKATPEQKSRLTEEFKTLLVRTYASALAAYSDQKFDFRPLHARPSDTDVTVQVRIIQPGTEPVSIDYGMEKTAAGWKAYDVSVGGVSLVANYRTEFGNIVRADGIDGLIRNLHAKNESLAQSGEQGKK